MVAMKQAAVFIGRVRFSYQPAQKRTFQLIAAFDSLGSPNPFAAQCTNARCREALPSASSPARRKDADEIAVGISSQKIRFQFVPKMICSVPNR
jgi:hypothetical protein